MLSRVCSCCVFLLFSIAIQAQDQVLPLVGNHVPTLIDKPGQPARAVAIVQAVMATNENISASIESSSQAWSGSGLRSGKYVGFIDHYSLNEEKPSYIYSKPYMSIELYVASKDRNNLDVTRLSKINRKSVGIENRFANTNALRGERTVRWVRSPTFIGLVEQLVDQRTDFIIADKVMLEEVNKLLIAAEQEPMVIASKPIYKVDLQLAINATVANAKSIINTFNANLDEYRKAQGTGKKTSESAPQNMLDVDLYAEIVEKW